jgi:hypothetical protein
MLDLHWFAILAHALCATAAFFVSVVLIFQRDALVQLRLARSSAVLLVLMEAFLVMAIISHLASLTVVRQIVFPGLAVLLLYVIWRALQAVRVLGEKPEDQGAVLGHVGFVLISLFDGFAIVSALDLHARAWLVAVIAAGAIAIGISLITMRRKALASTPVSRPNEAS